MSTKYKIMVVSGEASGDNHAASLIEELRASAPHNQFEFFGAAGSKMRDSGVDPQSD